MTRAELIEWVTLRIDELNPTGQTQEVKEDMVGRELDEGAKQILRLAKKQLVYPAGISYAPDIFITKDSNGDPKSIIIPLTSTYLRFLRLKMDYWNRPIDSVVSVDSGEYSRNFFNSIKNYSNNQPSLAIIPFQWTKPDEASEAKTIHDVVNGEIQNGVVTVKFNAAHGFNVSNKIYIKDVVGMADLTGEHTVGFVSSSFELLIFAAVSSATGTGGTAQIQQDTGTTFYKQALEAFPAPADLTDEMEDYQLATGANATLAEAANMVLVKNTSLTAGKKAIISDLQIVNELAAEAMPDSLFDGLVWLAAGRCLTALREPNLAAAAYAHSQSLVGNILVGLKGEEMPQVKN